MSYQTSTRSLPWRPSCNDADTTGTHKEQGQIVMNASAARFELSNNPCCFSSSTSGEHSVSISKGSEASGVDAIEAVVRGLRSSGRLFCEPPAGTSSIVEAAAAERRPAPLALFEGSVAVAVDTEDPYGDFRASMEEMVASHGDADDWGWLEGMLEWYLRANGEGDRGVIVEAFVDLLRTLASSPPLLFSSASCSEQKKKKMKWEKKKKNKNGSCS